LPMGRRKKFTFATPAASSYDGIARPHRLSHRC
jgi:hypothetical protein